VLTAGDCIHPHALNVPALLLILLGALTRSSRSISGCAMAAPTQDPGDVLRLCGRRRPREERLFEVSHQLIRRKPPRFDRLNPWRSQLAFHSDRPVTAI
jgi:hypothetical protein